MTSIGPATPAEFVTCTSCGDAGPAGSICPTCGGTKRIPLAATPALSPRRRWRLRVLRAGRATVVIGLLVSLGYLLFSAWVTGPPIASDPLTTTGAYTVPAGSFFFLSGQIVGGDYILGNYSVVAPVGAYVTCAVYNSTEFVAFGHHQSASPSWSLPAQLGGRIIFDALYTDTFSIVFVNPYPAESGINLTVFATTTYETNIVLG